MANVGFGLTQLDILGSGTPVIESSSGSIEFALGSGTPKIESTTGNLELKATNIRLNGVVNFGSNTITIDGDNGFINTGIITAINGVDVGSGVNKVSISTVSNSFIPIGLKVGTGVTISSGIITATGAIKVGTGVTISSGIITAIGAIKVGTGVTISSGIVTATSFSGSGNDIVTARWTLGADNTFQNYTFTGPGGLNNTTDPKLYLARGQTYEFVNNSGGNHPFQIQQSNGTAYNTGVTNNGAATGTIKFEVPFSAPNTLQYKCTVHGNMGQTIIIYPDLSP